MYTEQKEQVVLMIFCLNRPDIFSADDIGLLKAMGKNYFNNIGIRFRFYCLKRSIILKYCG